jgi:AAA domain
VSDFPDCLDGYNENHFDHQFAAEGAMPRPNGGRTHGAVSQMPVVFTPKPFKYQDPDTLPRRQFLYARQYIRGFLSATLAAGGVGKSSLALVEAVAMASGRTLLGIKPQKPLHVWYVNLEDPREEIERRVAAICLHFGIGPKEINGRLFFNGCETEIVLASQTKSGAIVANPVVAGLTAALQGLDVFTLDPFVSAHRVTENDNMAIDVVVKTLGRIAGEARTSIELIHHARKTNGAEITVEDGRGASALIAAARSVRVLNAMTKEEAETAGVGESSRFYFRENIGKANLAPPSTKATWFRLEGVPLGNGSGGDIDDQDYVGVATPWRWPDAFAGVTLSDLGAVQARISEGRWRENSQAKDWVGYAVASVLKLDGTNRAHRAKIKAMLKQLIANGALVIVEGEDAKRNKRSFIEVGEPASELCRE